MGEVGAGAGPCTARGNWGLAEQQKGIFQAPVVLLAQSRQVRNKGHVSKSYLLPVVVMGIAQSLTQQAVGHVAGNLCQDRQARTEIHHADKQSTSLLTLHRSWLERRHVRISVALRELLCFRDSRQHLHSKHKHPTSSVTGCAGAK